jgi:hypothetical protein
VNDERIVPPTVRWASDFINRIGFPIFAFCVISYLLFIKIGHMEENYKEQTDRMVVALNTNTEAITALRHFLTHKYDN